MFNRVLLSQGIVLDSSSHRDIFNDILGHFLHKTAEKINRPPSQHPLLIKTIINLQSMQPRGIRPQFRNEAPEYQEDPAYERRKLLAQIQAQKQSILKMQDKISHYQKQYKKMTESNQRNIKRLIRHRNRLQQLVNHRNEPEYFLHICGFMNEYMQEFMLTHDVHIMNVQEGPNPDNMSYEVWVEVMCSNCWNWAKVSGRCPKAYPNKNFKNCHVVKTSPANTSTQPNNIFSCPICCTEFSTGETAVALSCKHLYHEECIMEWLKDENTCPICKKYVLDK